TPAQAFFLARFNTNGTLDTTFGAGGSVVYNPGVGAIYTGGVAIQGDGKILVTGMEAGNDADGVDRQGQYVLRYTTSGALDATFGAGGVVYLVNPSGLLGQNSAAGVAVQADGEIVVGGEFAEPSGAYFAIEVMRVSSTGTLDTGFGDNGWAGVQWATGGATV